MGKTTKRAATFLLALALILTSIEPMRAKAAVLDGYPGIDELEAISTIPDPFEFFDTSNDPNGDGYVSDTAEWEARREEIKDLAEHYWLGYRWPTAAEDVQGTYRDEPIENTASYGGFWGIGQEVYNLGDEFTELQANVKETGVTVNSTTYGPVLTDDEAKTLAIEAWNAGYGKEYPAKTVEFFGMSFPVAAGTAVFVNKTGPISPESIPAVYTGEYYHYLDITITNPEEHNASGAAITAAFTAKIDRPDEDQLTAAWGSADVQVPFVIDIGGSAAFSAENLNEQGYGRLTFTPTDIYPDDSSAADGISRDGVYTTLYPYDANDYKHASGALMAWNWAVSQIITALENTDASGVVTSGELAGLDPSRTVVTGHSRYGKAAMFAAAFDDRISICSPSEPGGSGIQSYRYKVEGKIFGFNAYSKADRVYGKTEVPTVSYGSGNSWFPETAAMFVAKDNQIPFDSDELIALVAPRPFFVVSGIDTHWLGNEGGVASVQAAAEVYNFIGEDETEKNNIAVRCRESNHVFYPRDFCFALSIMDREFKQDASDTTLHVQDLFPEGTGISGMSYPAADYDNISDFNSYPFEINSSYMPWSSANKYSLWTAQESFLVAHDVTITAHSNAPDVDLYLPDGRTRIDATSHEGDAFIFKLTAAQSIYGRYELRTVGSEKENRSVYFAAVSLSDSLRHGTTKGDEGEENRVLGFASRLANTPSDAPLVYVGGSSEAETMSFTAERVIPEATSLLEYGILFHDNLFSRIADAGWDSTKTFDIKNLKFVTIPDYTFEFSMSNIAASSANNGKDQAAAFTKPISWNVEKYNNGPAAVWPELPDTVEERAAIEAGETITRSEAPEKTVTDFDTQITDITSVLNGDNTEIKISFSEPLNTGEYAIGLDIASKWSTSWNIEGTSLTLTIADEDIKDGAKEAGIIIFRLMDTDGNLIGGPIERSVEIPYREITLNQTGTYKISVALENVAQAAKTFTVTNTGTKTSGELELLLTGDDADYFTLDKQSISDIAAGESASFTITPSGNFAAKTYNAVLTVNGSRVEAKSFNIAVTAFTPIVIGPVITPAPSISNPGETPESGEDKSDVTPGPGEDKPDVTPTPTEEIKTDEDGIIKTTETNKAGNEVSKEIQTVKDEGGEIISETTKTVITDTKNDITIEAEIANYFDGSNEEVNVIVKREIRETKKGSLAVLSANVRSQIEELLNTDNANVTTVIKDSQGDDLYTVTAKQTDLVPGNRLYLCTLDSKTGLYIMLDGTANKVTKKGNLYISAKAGENYILLNKQDMKNAAEAVFAAISLRKSVISIKTGKTASITLSDSIANDNIKSISYSAGKNSGITVTKSGKITVKKSGSYKVNVTVTLLDGTGKSYIQSVTVK